ncbi:hypothetical protein VTI74DRAFT_4050 [Chaetomium olivicolor]
MEWEHDQSDELLFQPPPCLGSSISIRRSIRWLPAEEGEPTSTIVLSTPGHRFVDLRVFKPLPPLTQGYSELPLSQLDWAIAGLSVTVTDDEIDEGGPGSWFNPEKGSAPGKWVQHNRWHHWIDSRTSNAEEVVDEGDIFECPFSPDLILERGRMVNPETGKMTDYEEVWRSEFPHRVPMRHAHDPTPDVECIALQWQGEEVGERDQRAVKRGLVVRVGRYCQGLLRDGDSITAIREEWDKHKQEWMTVVKIGKEKLPMTTATSFASDLCVGAKVTVAGRVWEVVEWVN